MNFASNYDLDKFEHIVSSNYISISYHYFFYGDLKICGISISAWNATT